MDPTCGKLGVVSVVVRAADGAIANGLGGGTMMCGDATLDPGGDVRMAMDEEAD